MDNLFTQAWNEIAARPEGPLALRFYLQPAMATLLAIRDGLKDAQNGRPAYFWTVFTDSVQRRELMRHGWKSITKIFTLAVVLDLVYQFIVLHGLRPLQAVLVAVGLAIVPYAMFRGPVNRIAKRWIIGHSA
jgi:hypothetical protein